MDASPAQLGRYELGDVIGRGAMGTVYRAYDSVLDRLLAVKTVHPHLATRESVRLRFEREVRTASKLNHPNVVIVYDGGIENEQPFIAMELVEGSTLEAVLATRRLRLDEAIRIVLALCDAMTYAHGEGVIHRDLKP
ncbi:MAG: serine/threonine-protein kinase, partial [Candidatus Binatia bacterium]